MRQNHLIYPCHLVIVSAFNIAIAALVDALGRRRVHRYEQDYVAIIVYSFISPVASISNISY